ncbi:MAG: DUF2953 domain-containing protein [Lachnospiraceae bacterium]|nr:DUF2953 domain-containing protein [Lachnospiraceae bacterium]
MLHILIVILKIIGILLVVLLGIILFLLLAVLFLPICYKMQVAGRLEEEKELQAELKVAWLLFRLKGLFSLAERRFHLRVCLLGLPLYDSDKKGKEKKEDSLAEAENTQGAEETQPIPDGNGQEVAEEDSPPGQQDENEQESTNEDSQSSEAEPDNPSETENSETENSETENEEEAPENAKKVGLKEKLINLRQKIQYTIEKICDKIKKILEDIRYYIAVIRSDTFRASFAAAKKELFRILRMIRPKKWQFLLTAGMGDPASTGQVMAVYGMLYPWIGNHVELTSDFERKVITVEGYIKGRITVVVLVVAALKLIINKNIRRLIKLLKKEEVLDGRQ